MQFRIKQEVIYLTCIKIIEYNNQLKIKLKLFGGG